MRKRLLSGIVALLLTSGFFFPASAPRPHDPAHWLEDVSLIISASEKSAFKALKTEAEREAFIRRFWRRRDPDPSTELNEYEQQHYRRLEYARSHFSFGKRGDLTDRGRAYVIHGEPDERLVLAARTVQIHIKGTVGFFPVDAPEMEIWTYHNLPGVEDLRGPVSFGFMRLSLSQVVRLFSLTRSDPSPRKPEFGKPSGSALPQGRNAGHDFRLVYAGTPLFQDSETFYQQLYDALIGGSSARIDRFDLARNVAAALRSPGERLEEEDEQRRRVRQEVASAVFFDTLRAQVGYWFLRAANGYTYIPFALHVPGSELDRKHPGDLVLLVEMRRHEKSAARFLDRIHLGEKSDWTRLRYEGLLYQTRMAVLPGEHKLQVDLLDRAGKRSFHLVRKVRVPDLAQAADFLSSVILCRHVESLREAKEHEVSYQRRRLTFSRSNPLRIDDFLLLPAVDRTLRRKDVLTLFFEVYEPGVGKGGKPDLEVELELEREGEPVGRSLTKRLRYWTRDALRKISYAFSVKLAAVTPGRYQARLRVRDRVTGKESVRSESFRIR